MNAKYKVALCSVHGLSRADVNDLKLYTTHNAYQWPAGSVPQPLTLGSDTLWLLGERCGRRHFNECLWRARTNVEEWWLLRGQPLPAPGICTEPH